MVSLKERLTEILVRNKVISPEQLKEALDVQKREGISLKDVLIKKGFVSEKELLSAFSQGLGIPSLVLSRFNIDPDILKLIPADLVRRYKIVPISKVGNMLTIATCDPLNVFTIDDLRSVTNMEIGTVIASAKEVEEVIEQHYLKETHEEIEKLIEDMKTEDVQIIKANDLEERVDSERIFKLIEEAPVLKLTNTIFENGIKERSSDILIEPMEYYMRVRYRIDGVLKEWGSIPKSMHQTVVSRIKVIAGLNIAESRLPQDGRFKMRIENNEIDFRVSILPSSKGEKVVLRVLNKSEAMLDVDKLGFDEDNLKLIKECISHEHGMILVCGPTGCGKTTTLYSLLKYIYTDKKNIITVEDPVEYQLPGINQVTIRSGIGLTFANVLRSILRQDPDIIMIGEIRDYETVDIAIKSALTGHLVLSTLHTTTACGSVIRLLNMGVEPFLISASLIAVVAQRLVRKLCPTCKEPYKVTQTLFSQLGIRDVQKSPKEDLVFYRAKGCKDCLNTGYTGRIGICEVLVMRHMIREMVLKNAKETDLKSAIRSQGLSTLRENGISNVIRGTTSLEEILKSTIEDKIISP